MSRPDLTAVTPLTLREWPLPEPGAGKSARGALAVVRGTATTPGAVVLAGEASLRAGAGKLSLATPEAVAPSLTVAMPEAMVVGLQASPRTSASRWSSTPSPRRTSPSTPRACGTSTAGSCSP